jgi:hypothetical protein
MMISEPGHKPSQSKRRRKKRKKKAKAWSERPHLRHVQLLAWLGGGPTCVSCARLHLLSAAPSVSQHTCLVWSKSCLTQAIIYGTKMLLNRGRQHNELTKNGGYCFLRKMCHERENEIKQ